MEEHRRKRGRPKDSGMLDDQIRIRMNHEVLEEVREISKKCDVNQSDFIRMAIREKLDSVKRAEKASKNDVIDYDPDDYWLN